MAAHTAESGEFADEMVAIPTRDGAFDKRPRAHRPGPAMGMACRPDLDTDCQLLPKEAARARRIRLCRLPACFGEEVGG